MDDSWQETAFSSRHMHNRQNRNAGSKGHSGKSKRNTFDVRKTFGSYTVKCPAWHKLYTSGDGVSSGQDAVLELYRLTKCGTGVVGEMSLPGVLRAAVLLAASRKSLQAILDRLEPVEPEVGDEAKEHDEGEEQESDEESDEEEEESEEESEPDRFETFEKNSFREPKFWLRWNGVLESMAAGGDEKAESGMGYIIFPSNDCRKFKGTLNCATLEWKDVAFSGHKIAPRSESDIPVAWGSNEVPM
ncbi:hypothetical protein QM012_005993 [Aureobasidium pullulans]|uniref:Uncharacterized protein n=1 Tax=Aureobasidium pullulans TaxID=5580 RepID=A0ABR0TST8_AURPU